MIFTDRSAVPPHLDQTDPDSAAEKELTKAKEHVLAHNTKPPSDMFKAYSDLSVRDALRDLFNNKCAYCESRMAGAQDSDIEHFRPKAEVTDAKKAGVDHPGYWWLAMDWANLVLSCSHCNQLRKQIIVDPGMTEDEVRALVEADDRVLVGKKSAFPTANDRWVTTHTGDVEVEEEPLLIDPTRVRPEAHLDWVLDGVFSTVRAKNGSLMGETSIRVYGLNRRRLTEDRMVVLSELRNLGNKVIAALRRADIAESAEAAEAHRQAASEHVDSIAVKCDKGNPFSALAKAFLSELISEVEAMA